MACLWMDKERRFSLPFMGRDGGEAVRVGFAGISEALHVPTPIADAIDPPLHGAGEL